MKIVHTNAGIEPIPLKAKHHHDGAMNDHDGIKDPHIWLSPSLVMIQASHIRDALISIDPTHGAFYRANHNAFMNELEGLDQKIKGLFSNKKGAHFLVYHPSWGYFARTYGLDQIPIELEGKEPTPKELKDLIKFGRDHHVKAIFVQPQFSTKSAETVAKAIGAQVVFADPLELNWADNLFKVAEKLNQALR